MNLILLFVAAMAVGLGMLMVASWRVPVGYEDESLFRGHDDGETTSAPEIDDVVPEFAHY